MAARMPIMAMTTNNSMIVKARVDFRLRIMDFRGLEEEGAVNTKVGFRGLNKTEGLCLTILQIVLFIK
jgi:hypothetical protein